MYSSDQSNGFYNNSPIGDESRDYSCTLPPYSLRSKSLSKYCSPIIADEYQHLFTGKESCDKSNSGDEDIEEKSAAHKQKYAAIALDKLNADDNTCFKLVETGLLGVGDFPKGRIIHLNFKAKEDKPDAEVQTFFAELVRTRRNVFCACVFYLGPSLSLPEKADTLGCLYCGSLQIYHPEWSYDHRTGREEHYLNLCSEVKKIDKYIDKCERKKITPTFWNPGVEYTGEIFGHSAAKYEDVALRVYNTNQDTNFVLVKTGFFEQESTSVGVIQHMNFIAKKNERGATLQTFFAEVIIRGYYFFVDFCECLGPSDDLPRNPDEVDVQGCCYCGDSRVIHHPPGPGYANGRNNLIYEYNLRLFEKKRYNLRLSAKKRYNI